MKRVGCLGYEAALGRRDFLRAGSLSLLGISLSQYLELKSIMAAAGIDAQKQAKAQACILLWLEGGPAQMDTFDPKPSSGFKPISTNVPGIQISEILPRTARHMDKLSIIRSMHHEEVDHPNGKHYNMTGHRPTPAMKFPSIGSILSKEMGPRNGVPPYVLGAPHLAKESHYGAAHLGPKYDPMVVPDPSKKDFQIVDLTLPKSITVERIEDRQSFLDVVAHQYRQKERMGERSVRDGFRDEALKMILSPTVKKAFDLSQESEKTREAYGWGGYGLGQSALLARRLVEAGCRFVTAAGNYTDSGWDTHGKGSGGENDPKIRSLLGPTLDHTLSTLLEDLEQRGLLESTIVIAMGEFGRTPEKNQINGRDHWPFCFSAALGGGGIRGGQVIGASDERAAYPAERPISAGDLFATLYKAFGIDWTKEYMTPVGRPIKIANAVNDKTGAPIEELI